jgi:hypothetical protein
VILTGSRLVMSSMEGSLGLLLLCLVSRVADPGS